MAITLVRLRYGKIRRTHKGYQPLKPFHPGGWLPECGTGPLVAQYVRVETLPDPIPAGYLCRRCFPHARTIREITEHRDKTERRDVLPPDQMELLTCPN